MHATYQSLHVNEMPNAQIDCGVNSSSSEHGIKDSALLNIAKSKDPLLNVMPNVEIDFADIISLSLSHHNTRDIVKNIDPLVKEIPNTKIDCFENIRSSRHDMKHLDLGEIVENKKPLINKMPNTKNFFDDNISV